MSLVKSAMMSLRRFATMSLPQQPSMLMTSSAPMLVPGSVLQPRDRSAPMLLSKFHSHYCEVDCILEYILSCIQSRRIVLELAQQHRCTPVSWLVHTSWHQHWSTARHQHTWSLRQGHCRKPPQEHHCSLDEAH